MSSGANVSLGQVRSCLETRADMCYITYNRVTSWPDTLTAAIDIYLYLSVSLMDSFVLLLLRLLRLSLAVYQREVASHASNPSCWISHPGGKWS